MQPTLEQLACIRVLAPLPAAELSFLQSHAIVHTYQSGELVMTEGDRLPACLYAVASGTIQVSKTATTGKETILRVLSTGEIFAAPALVGDGMAPATVTATSDCQIVRLEREALLSMIRQTPEVALEMMMVFNQRLQQLHDTIHGLVSERAIVRLARLLQYAAIEQGVTTNGQSLPTPLPYYQIARSIGITYEECVRLFKSLNAVVKYQRGKIQILDLERLETIAAGEME